MIKKPLNFLSSPGQSLGAPLKYVLTVVGIAAFLISASSCTTGSLVHVPTGEVLKGTWTQTGAGYERGIPVTWENQTVVIDKAFGQGFAGFKEYTREGEPPQKESLNGVIGVNGNILIVDEDGTFEGRLIDGKLQGYYAEIGDDVTAINLVMTRQQR